MTEESTARRGASEVLWNHLELAREGTVDDGADSYVIRNGRIVAQSIHDTLQTAS